MLSNFFRILSYLGNSSCPPKSRRSPSYCCSPVKLHLGLTANIVDRCSGRVMVTASTMEKALKEWLECGWPCNSKVVVAGGKVLAMRLKVDGLAGKPIYVDAAKEIEMKVFKNHTNAWSIFNAICSHNINLPPSWARSLPCASRWKASPVNPSMPTTKIENKGFKNRSHGMPPPYPPTSVSLTSSPGLNFSFSKHTLALLPSYLSTSSNPQVFSIFLRDLNNHPYLLLASSFLDSFSGCRFPLFFLP